MAWAQTPWQQVEASNAAEIQLAQSPEAIRSWWTWSGVGGGVSAQKIAQDVGTCQMLRAR